MRGEVVDSSAKGKANVCGEGSQSRGGFGSLGLGVVYVWKCSIRGSFSLCCTHRNGRFNGLVGEDRWWPHKTVETPASLRSVPLSHQLLVLGSNL